MGIGRVMHLVQFSKFSIDGSKWIRFRWLNVEFTSSLLRIWPSKMAMAHTVSTESHFGMCVLLHIVEYYILKICHYSYFWATPKCGSLEAGCGSEVGKSCKHWQASAGHSLTGSSPIETWYGSQLYYTCYFDVKTGLSGLMFMASHGPEGTGWN